MSTSIEWTDETWNPLRGCTAVSAGCLNCYAQRMAHRFSGPGKAYHGLTKLTTKGPRWTGVVRTVPELLEEPLHWRKPRRVFVNSMSDLFHPDVPDEFICRVFDIMRRCEQHVFQVLTKRPERMADFCSRLRFDGYGAPGGRVSLADTADGPGYRLMGGNGCTGMTWVWLGTSCEDQAAADERIPHLLRVPAAVRLLSLEPLIGPIDLREFQPFRDQKHGPLMAALGVLSGWVDWVIVGGESGPGARPCNIDWIEDIVAQCKRARVPVFVKQLGARPYWQRQTNHNVKTAGGRLSIASLELETSLKLRDAKGGDWDEWAEHLRVREFPKVAHAG